MTRAALVTIDVEPDNVWTDTYSRTMRNIPALIRFQALCDRHGIRPTYLITWSVASDPSAARVIEQLLATGRCEVGAHSHMWETPPLEPADSDGIAHVGSFYAAASQEAKLGVLTETIRVRFGAPTSHRAGRFGIDQRQARVLARLGYEVDSSVAPGFDMSTTGAPDFSEAGQRPSVLARGPAAVLKEVPCTTHRGVLPRPVRSNALLRRLGQRIGAGPRMLRAFPRTSVRRLTSLSAWATRRFGFVNLMTHSSELEAGTSPYWPSATDVARHWAALDVLFGAWAALGTTPMTLSEYARSLDEGALAEAPLG